MRTWRIATAAVLVAALLASTAFPAWAAESGSAAPSHAERDRRVGIPAALLLAYLAGKTGQPPVEIARAIREHGLKAVLERAGITREELQQTFRQIHRIVAELRDRRDGKDGADQRRLHAAIARAVAELSGKAVGEVLKLRRELGSWEKVIAALGLDPEAVRAKVREILGERRGRLDRPVRPAQPGSGGAQPGDQGGAQPGGQGTPGGEQGNVQPGGQGSAQPGEQDGAPPANQDGAQSPNG